MGDLLQGKLYNRTPFPYWLYIPLDASLFDEELANHVKTIERDFARGYQEYTIAGGYMANHLFGTERNDIDVYLKGEGLLRLQSGFDLVGCPEPIDAITNFDFSILMCCLYYNEKRTTALVTPLFLASRNKSYIIVNVTDFYTMESIEEYYEKEYNETGLDYYSNLDPSENLSRLLVVIEQENKEKKRMEKYASRFPDRHFVYVQRPAHIVSYMYY
jgi:hypothetical protein